MARIFLVLLLCSFLLPSTAVFGEKDDLVAKIAHELEIRRVVDSVDATVDAKDWEKCRSLLADEIDVDFSSLTGAPPAHIKSDDLVGAWKNGLFPGKSSFHMRSNHIIEIKGDSAEVFSKGYALNILDIKNGSDLWEVWGDYRHTLKKTEKGWKVSSMKLTVIYARGNLKVFEATAPAASK